MNYKGLQVFDTNLDKGSNNFANNNYSEEEDSEQHQLQQMDEEQMSFMPKPMSSTISKANTMV